MVLQELAVHSQKNSHDLVKKEIRFIENESVDKMNAAARKIHTKYVKLQQEYSNLRDVWDQEKKNH